MSTKRRNLAQQFESYHSFSTSDTPKELHSQVSKTSTGRTSGETSVGAEGARVFIKPNLSGKRTEH